jgi:uncharacterized protein (DUF362 family)
MNRREFLKQLAIILAAGAGAFKLLGRYSPVAAATDPRLIVAYDGEPAALLKAALAEYGGLGKWVKPGMTVSIKANFTWNGPPEQACNSNPDLVAALVKECLRLGAKKVRVIDLTINPANMTMKISGVKEAVLQAGGEIVNLQGAPVREVSCGPLLGQMPIFREALEAECLINLPILKNHSGAKMTACLKSYMGLTTVEGRGRMHSVGLQGSIVEVAKVIKPHLHIIDAYRILKTRGPQGPGEVELAKLLIIAEDPVAADAYGASLLGVNPMYLEGAAKAGLGVADLSRIKIVKVKA